MHFARPAIIQLNGKSLTDHNRDPLGIDIEFLHEDVRTARGAMRRFWKGQKHTFDLSWVRTPRYAINTVDRNWSGQEIMDFIAAQEQPVDVTIYGNDWTLSTDFIMLPTGFNASIYSRRDIELWNFSFTLEEV